jgi:hypothetical protein
MAAIDSWQQRYRWPFMSADDAEAGPPHRTDRMWPRTGGTLIVIGAVSAFVAELIYPRADKGEGKFFTQIAHGPRFPVSYLLAGFAALALTVGLIALCDALPTTTAKLARRAVPAGLALVLAQMWGTAPAQRMLARDWLAVPNSDATSAFWAAESIARIDGFLVDAWSVMFFAVVPGLLASGMWRHRQGPRPLVSVVGIGAVVTFVVALLDLGGSTWDLTLARTVGAVFTIVWLVAVGVLLVREKLASPDPVAATLTS